MRATTAFELKTRKSLGQHLLQDSNVVRRICNLAKKFWPEGEPLCHEIGPGSAALTLPLLENGWEVHAIEKDPVAADGLLATLLPQYPTRFFLNHEDVLRFTPTEHGERVPLLVGNIPYYITSDILLWFCRWRTKYRGAVLMMQKEVAERLVAKPDTREYGRLSVRLQLTFDVQNAFVVPAAAFHPRPKVDSAVVIFSPRDAVPSEVDDPEFEKFTAMLFGARRKMLRRALARSLEPLSEPTREQFWQRAGSLGVVPEARPDTLSPSQIVGLFAALGAATGRV